jgi:hypothetical protein
MPGNGTIEVPRVTGLGATCGHDVIVDGALVPVVERLPPSTEHLPFGVAHSAVPTIRDGTPASVRMNGAHEGSA